MTLDDLLAESEIRQVLYRYCRGVDRGDRALIASVYHPGAIDEHGPFKGLGADFPDNLVPRMDATKLIGQHCILNELMEIDGTEARVESYFLAMQPSGSAEDGTAIQILVMGRYLDIFEKRDGTWLIAHRRVILDYTEIMNKDAAWPRAALFPAGKRRDQDASHGFFKTMA